MCNVDIYPGNHIRRRRCRAYRNGEPCEETTYYHTEPAPINIPGASTAHHHLPPSPRLTPGSSPMLGSYHSSPRVSYHESDSDSSHRRRSRRPAVYINGEPLTPRDSSPSSSRHRRRSSSSASSAHRYYEARPRGERIIIVENPPIPRTPPQQQSVPRTEPSSPSRLHEGLRNRPVIVDDRERPEPRRVRISVPSSSDASEGSSSGPGGRRARRRERRAEKEEQVEVVVETERRGEEEEEQARRRRREAMIEEANKRIAERAEQPVSRRPERPAPRRSGTAYVRPAVEIHAAQGVGLGVEAEEEIVSGVRGVRLDDEDEEEAMRQRLKERMMPQRRASIGPGSRRVRVQYEDGMYRLE